MKMRKMMAMAAIAALAFGATACGDDGSDSAAPKVEKDVKFDAGTTMEKLNKAQKVAVGTKFDQPLFGLKGLDGKPAGFDVEIAKIIAAKLGVPADKIEWVETPSKVREEVIEQGKVDFVVATYTINDKRKLRISFAGPYYTAGQDIMVKKDDTSITGPDSFKDGTKKVCSVTGSTPAEKIKTYLKDPGQPAGALRRVLQVRRRPEERPGRRGDHGQRDPARPDRQGQGSLQAGRRALHRGALRHRREEGRRGVQEVHQRHAGGRWPRTARTRRRGRTPPARSRAETPTLPTIDRS